MYIQCVSDGYERGLIGCIYRTLDLFKLQLKRGDQAKDTMEIYFFLSHKLAYFFCLDIEVAPRKEAIFKLLLLGLVGKFAGILLQ